MQQNEEKNFLQGLKPVESTQFTSALKHRPPKEKDFSRSLLGQGRGRCSRSQGTSEGPSFATP
jgi:hypothetical protein